MRCIGLLGGMSWESSIEHERMTNEGARERLGGSHSADLIVRSYDFAAIEALQRSDRWEEAGALLAARYTMEQDFYRGRLATHGLEVVVPDEGDRAAVHDIIYQELVRGVVREESKRAYLDVVDRLCASGADGVIAGCTEIELLVGALDVGVPWFPTTRLHAAAAVDAALAPDPRAD